MIAGSSRDKPRTIEELLGAPLMQRLDRLDLLSRKVFAGRLPGERRSKRRGQSVEFDDYRQYVPGDDLRHIDWNVYARLERMFIKLFLEEEDIGLHLLFDASASMDAGTPNKLVFCQQLAMALGYVGLVKNNRFAVTVFGREKLRRLDECRGRRNIQRLGRFLLDVPVEVEAEFVRSEGVESTGADFTSAARALVSAGVGKGVLVVLSDFLFREGHLDGLRMLAARPGWDIHCLQVLAPDEIDPAMTGEAGTSGVTGDVRLIDVESGADVEVSITPALLARYRESLERFCARLADDCVARGMKSTLVRTDAPIESLLLDALRKRGMLR